MKQNFLFGATLLALAFSLWTSCTKPTPFGSELLEEQLDSIQYTDTVSMRFFIEKENDLITSDRSSTASYFLCGALQDPVFGRTESEIFSLFKLVSLNPNIDTTTDRLDSLVLFLNYNINGVYGDTTELHTLRIQRLNDPLVYDSLYTSVSNISAGNDVCNPLQFYPNPSLSKNVFDTASTALKAAHLRVRMNDAFAQEMFSICTDTNAVETDSAFWAAIRGLKISVSSPLDAGAMLAFSLNNNNVSLMRMYFTEYTDTDTTRKYIDFNFTRCNKFMRFTHAYESSPIQAMIGQSSDNLLCLQGMTGLRLRVEFPWVDGFDKISVNKALLEFTAASLPGDRPYLADNPSEQLLAKVYQGDSIFVNTDDVDFSVAAVNNYSYFGGSPKKVTENGKTIQQYSLNLSQQFQKLVDDTSGNIKNRTLYITAEPQRFSPRRALLYGPKSTVFPAKLILKYTKVE